MLHPDELADRRTEGIVRILPTQIIIVRDEWVSTERDIGLTKAETVRLDDHVGFLNKYNDLLGRDCEDMKATIKTLSLTDRKEDNVYHKSVLRKLPNVGPW